MEYAVGVLLALAISLLPTFVRFDRDRAFYPTLMIVIASYYDLFAIMGGSARALLLESIVMAAFVSVAIIGFRFNLWLVAAALLAHGIFDFIHARIISNPGAPAWWPGFCLGYDVAAAGYLAWILRRKSRGRLAEERGEDLTPKPLSD